MVHVVSTSTWAPTVGPLEGRGKPVQCITFSPDSKCVASGTRDGYIYLWDVKNGENLHVIRVCHREVDSIAFSPDGSVSFLVQLMVSFEPGMSG